MEELKNEEGGKMEMSFEKIAEENLDDWFRALHTGNPEEMREKYLPNCTFFPTLDAKLRRGTDEAIDYFENHFMPKHPTGHLDSVENQSIDKVSDSEIFHVGHYTFEVDGDNETRKKVYARFIFRWKKTVDGKWGILHHSSDKLPESH